MDHEVPEGGEQMGGKEALDESEKLLRDWGVVPRENDHYGALYPGAGEYAPSKVIAGKPLG